MDRDTQVVALMDKAFASAEKGDYSIEAATEKQIETLFDTTTWGFREIMLVVVIGRLLDPSYRPSAALYDCRPRALYEGPILASLRTRGIPARKSGPLNIAKAAQGLTKEWAAQRQPKRVAEEVVRLVRKMERMSQPEVKNLAVTLHARFLKEASRIAKLAVEAQPESDPAHLYVISCDLIDTVPDAGNTPQRIVGLLMEAYHQELQTEIAVHGHLDRASTTSTTSKKPGDITEEQLDGTVLVVYEVTVKPFGEQRVIESYETVRDYDRENAASIREVFVICRPEDVHPGVVGGEGNDSMLYLGRLEHQDLTYHFVDIWEWVMGQLVRMPADARLGFHEKLASYILDPNTSEAVKRRWAELQ